MSVGDMTSPGTSIMIDAIILMKALWIRPSSAQNVSLHDELDGDDMMETRMSPRQKNLRDHVIRVIIKEDCRTQVTE